MSAVRAENKHHGTVLSIAQY